MTLRTRLRELWFPIHWTVVRSRRFGPLYSRLQFWDDYDWATYTTDYSEMLEMKIDLLNTQQLRKANWVLEDGNVILGPEEKPMHVNHRLLYELIVKLAPGKAIEFGCGGGDLLSNIMQLLPDCQLIGIDQSPSQLELLRSRNPELLDGGVSLRIGDVTLRESVVDLAQWADLVYSQAVLMHIHGSGRPARYVENLVYASRRYVLLIENSLRHDYVSLLRNASGRDVQLITRKGAFALVVDLTSAPTYPTVRTRHELALALKTHDVFGRSVREGSPLWSYITE